MSSNHPRATDLKPGLLVSLGTSSATVTYVYRVDARVYIGLSDGTNHVRHVNHKVKSFGHQKKNRRKR